MAMVSVLSSKDKGTIRYSCAMGSVIIARTSGEMVTSFRATTCMPICSARPWAN